MFEVSSVKNTNAQRKANDLDGLTVEGVVNFSLDRMARSQLSSCPLTAREQEVVALMSQGHSSRVIAAQLFISLETVRAHRRNVYLKLGVSSQAELFAVMLESIIDGFKHMFLPESLNVSPAIAITG